MTTQIRQKMIEDGAFYSKAEADAKFRSLFVGMYADFPFLPPEPEWLPCYGQILNVADYPVLAAKFAARGVSYGGDGVTTFGLPDHRGRVSAGLDNMGGVSANRLTGQSGGVNGDFLGGAGGAETHQLSAAQMPQHNHTATVNDPGHSHSSLSGGAPVDGDGSPGRSAPIPGSTGSSLTGISVSIDNAGNSQPHNNVQPTIVVIRCVLAF